MEITSAILADDSPGSPHHRAGDLSRPLYIGIAATESFERTTAMFAKALS